jgi:Putative addiction module component
MMNTEQILSSLQQLTLVDRASVLAALEDNVADEYDQLVEQSLREDIRIVEQRLAEFDAGTIESQPWDEVRRRVFGH